MTDPHQEGYVAACEGKSAFDNPYDISTHLDHNCDWHDGYLEALNDEHARYERRQFWLNLRASFWDGFVNILYAAVFVAVCWAVGFGIRHLVATL